jgi:hypothetical protein
MQSFTIPDLRTLRANASEELVYPYMFGARSNCSSASPVAAASQFPEVSNAQHKSDLEQAWMPNGWERTMSYTAWTDTAAHTAETAGEQSRFGLYVGSHDRESRLKMMPVFCSSEPTQRVAGLRAVHVPDSFDDGSTVDFILPCVHSCYWAAWDLQCWTPCV